MSLNNTSSSVPTLVAVPCFSGAPWALEDLHPLQGRPQMTLRLPEGLADVELYADALADSVGELGEYVLAGDSYGAVISLALAVRRPRGLVGLVLSGGFAANPLPRWKAVAAGASRFANGALYRQGVLRFHASQLHSAFDATAERPHTPGDYRQLFIDNTPRRSYTARVTSVTGFDVRDRLGNVDVPTLVITPEDDKLVGPDASRDMLRGIRGAREIILPETGHMFRFTHPTLYGRTIADFMDALDDARASARAIGPEQP